MNKRDSLSSASLNIRPITVSGTLLSLYGARLWKPPCVLPPRSDVPPLPIPRQDVVSEAVPIATTAIICAISETGLAV